MSTERNSGTGGGGHPVGDPSNLRNSDSNREASHHMTRSMRTVLAALVAVLTTLASLAVVGVSPASASTVNGIATTVNPSNNAYLASGGSDTQFTLKLPPNADCDGDTATDGYHVWSYLVPKGTNISSLTFSGDTGPSAGLGLFDDTASYIGPINTAITTGQVVNIPNDMEWGQAVADDAFPASQLLDTTGGVWEGGLACANTDGDLTDNWNTQFTFTASGTDPNRFVWSAIPGPSGSAVSDITSANTTNFPEGAHSSFTVTATGNPTPTITEATGVTFAGGVLSGTPTTGGNFPITFTATNGIGNPAVQSFTLTVGGPPTFTSPDSTSFQEGVADSFTPTASGSPTPTITEVGTLPTGVTFTDGVLAGTPTENGAFLITFTAGNGILPNASQPFTLNVGLAPTITSANNATFQEGVADTFTVTATGTPTPTITESGTLPTGVTFAGGVLSGTPTVGGTFHITFTATNVILPVATQAFTLSVDSAPAITSASSTTFTEGTAGTFTVVATGTPAPTIAETGTLPAGVTFAGGVLSGTATATGTFAITFTAHNGIGTDATQLFVLTVASAPTITSADSTTFTVGTAGTFTPTATGFPTPTIAESGTLPAGVTFTEGILSGTPTAGGVFPITFTASNGAVPDAVQHFTLTVNAPAAITSADTATFTIGTANSFTVTKTGTPSPTLSETGALPAGVTFVPGTGVLSGTPTAKGSYLITFTATNGIGTAATQSFTLVVQYPPLVVSSSSLAGGTVGSAYSATLTATGGESPYTWSVSVGALPAGLSLAASTGVISGTPTASGTADFTVEVADSDAATATKALSIVIAGPVVAPTTLTQPVVGIAAAPGGLGYWLTDAAGDVAPLGSVQTYGSLAGVTLNAPIVQIVAAPDGHGYWLVAADGGVFAFGSAGFHGSTGGLTLNAPIVGLAATTDGGGYWLVGSDGGVFAYGDAVFQGSMGGVPLNKPVVGITADSATGGYWLAAADGGVFAFGAPFLGSTAQLTLNRPVVGIAATTDGGGYWLVASDGGIFSLGDAVFQGSTGSLTLNAPVSGIAVDPATGGYWLIGSDGGVFAFGAPFFGAD
jgi:hypothetical protein